MSPSAFPQDLVCPVVAWQRQDNPGLIGALEMLPILFEDHTGMQDFVLWLVQSFQAFANPGTQCQRQVVCCASIDMCGDGLKVRPRPPTRGASDDPTPLQEPH